jgi:predicted glutamine amidotransferase
MCRIFAMAADQDLPPVIKSRLLREFFQSSAETYSGGWGIGYFTDQGPMVMKEPIKATDSFALPGAIRRSEPGFVMAHVRNPTSGDRSLLNTHPFQKNGWLFSHNGTLGDPLSLKAGLLERYSDTLMGDTDSEIMFHFLLQRIEQGGQAEQAVLSAVRDLCREQCEGTTSLNFALTDGTVLFVYRKAFINDGKYPINYANLQTLSITGGEKAQRDHASSNATVISSEPFTPGEWSSLEMGEMLIANADGHRVIKV